MRSKRVKTFLFSPLVLATFLFAGRLEAQFKVAIVDFQNALLATAEMQKAGADLEAKLRPRQQEVESLSKELQEIQSKLQSATGAEAIGLQNDAQRKQRDAQRKSEDLQADYEFERGEILQKASLKMREVLSKLSEEKNLDLVVDITNTLYFKPALDVTKEATVAYDKAYPVATP